MVIPVVFATDRNFVMPTCVTIHSLLTSSHRETEYAINVITDPDVTEQDKDLMRKQISEDSKISSINFVAIGDIFAKGYEIRDISKACYSRLMIPWLLPQYDKVIYSDVDIIFKGDLSQLFEQNAQKEDFWVAGVNGEVWKKGLIKKYLLKIGANPEEYINSGFLIINAKKQREEDLKEQYLEFSKKKFLYQDQDIINLVCKSHIEHLPTTYNIKPSDYYKYSPDEAKVIHYIGFKPWEHFTYSWVEWWKAYGESIVFDPEFNKKISTGILKWNKEIANKQKALQQKFNFLRRYLMFK